MSIDVQRVTAEQALPLRELHRAEMACQIVHDSLPARGLSHVWEIRLDEEPIGYGCVVGFGDDPKDTVDEFFLLPEHRGRAQPAFEALVAATGARSIQAQTNDPRLMLMLFDFATDIERDRILFEDGFATELRAPDATFRRVTDADLGRPFGDSELKDAREWILEVDGEVVAAGGVLFHYNPPFGDIYMAVAETHRRRGYGSFFVQELKRAARDLGKTPAARCNTDNPASRATLLRAGMVPCGGIVTGRLVRPGA